MPGLKNIIKINEHSNMNGSILVSEIKEWNRTKSISMAYDILNKLNRSIDCGRVIVRVGKGKGNIFMNKFLFLAHKLQEYSYIYLHNPNHILQQTH
mgnify:CR=1 FL=1